MKRILAALLLIASSAIAAEFGDIPANLTIGAGQSVRRNAGNTLFEAYTPQSSLTFTTSVLNTAGTVTLLNDSTPTPGVRYFYGTDLAGVKGFQPFITTSGGGGIQNFTDLADVPNSYSGQSLKGVRVNGAENALEFYTTGGGGTWGSITGTLSDQTDLWNVLTAHTTSLYLLAPLTLYSTGDSDDVVAHPYTAINSGILVKDANNVEILRIWAGDPDVINNYSSGNLYVGFEAGLSQPTNPSDFGGFRNTAVGRKALRAITTGAGNTALGDESLLVNTEGYGNTAVGSQAGGSNLSGVGPVLGITTGNYNTIVGNQAMPESASGVDEANVAVGYRAGELSDGDSGCVFIGARSGRSTGSVTGNAIAIGYLASAPASNTAVIGNNSITDVYFGTTPGLADANAVLHGKGVAEVYDATTWNGNLTIPTKNDIRDKIESMSGGSVDDTAFASSWNGVTTIAPSKNAVYDWGHTFDTDDNGKVNVLDQVAGIAVTNSSGVLQTPITDNHTNWDTSYTDRLKWDGGATGLTAATGRTSLGATTVGSNIFTLTNPSAISWPEIAADNTVSTKTASQMRTDLSLVVGTDVQAWDTQLDSLAGLAYTGNALKVVRVNAGETAFELATASGGAPGGSNTQVQYNNSSAFGGITNATTNGTTLTLTSPAIVTSITGAAAYKLTTAGTDLKIEQTGDTLGTSSLTLENRAGSAGANFANAALDLVDMGFMPNSGVQSNIRLEHRGTNLNDASNSLGEVQFLIDSLTTGTHAYQVLGVGAGAATLGVPLKFGVLAVNSPLTNVDVAFARSATGLIEVNSGTVGTFKDLKADHLNAVTGFQVNGAATSRKVLVGNGTNFVASTETYAVPGTSGNVLTSDGTNWTSAPAPGGGSTTGHGDSAYSILSTDRIVYPNATFTGTRTWTLPAANSVAGGTSISIIDLQGRITSSNAILIAKTGSDTIEPSALVSTILRDPKSGAQFTSDGTSRWYVTYWSPGTTTSTGAFMAWDNVDFFWRLSAWTLPATNAVIGSSGKMLQSSSTTGSAWSTPTWPTTAGTSGKLVQSDGTNLITSTTTWPSGAAATTGKVVKSDGTNWVASTETYAAPGTSGNLLKSDGTNWTSAAQSTITAGNVTTNANLTGPVTSSGNATTIVGPVPNSATLDGITNFNSATQSQAVSSGTEYYVTSSNLTMPATFLTPIAAGTTFKWHVAMTKTAAGTGTFQILLKHGANGSTADTTDATVTIGTQTAVADQLVFDLQITFTSTTAYYYALIPRQYAARITGFGLDYPLVASFFTGTVSGLTTTTGSTKWGMSFKATTGTPTITVPMIQAQAFNVN